MYFQNYFRKVLQHIEIILLKLILINFMCYKNKNALVTVHSNSKFKHPLKNRGYILPKPNTVNTSLRDFIAQAPGFALAFPSYLW